MDPIRILIADDHTLLRNALAELLCAEEDFSVTGVAADAPEMLRLAAETRPHVVLMDIEMPGNDHPPATVRRLRELAPRTQVIVLSMHDDPALVQSLLPLGIRGFLHKTVTRQALAAAVRDACAPGGQVMMLLSADSLAQPAPVASSVVLSERETQVVELAAQGLSNLQIAHRLGIVEGTVKRHLQKVFEKLGARSRVEAANRAIEQGLIQPPVRSFGSDRWTPAARPVSRAG
ncbi:response regulator transcription factor [Streptomyces sp. CT34]|uniref:response regulator n=1 Tax=Streptomyces sp. CT34 TaxID=1553907 RepID=UPI00068E3637|nr:response regulator transcription factor [Streptomyces sp. CT34]